jgi:hypothetical protein
MVRLEGTGARIAYIDFPTHISAIAADAAGNKST